MKWESASAGAIAILIAAASGLARGADPPQPAAFRTAFEAQYPKTSVTGGALALETLAAAVGIDLVPRDVEPEVVPDAATTPPAVPQVRVSRRRVRPTEAAAKELTAIASLASLFTEREVKTSTEKIGPPPAALERFLSERDGEISEIRSQLLREEEVAWEMDVSQRSESPFPGLQGVMRLQRILLSRALVESRSGKNDDALQTLEASWNLNAPLRGRPEIICQLILLAMGKLQVGVLRKIDAPAFGWADRLRSGEMTAGYVAAFENQIWFVDGTLTDLTGKNGGWGRVYRRLGEEFHSRSLCASTPESLRDAASRARLEELDHAESGEPDPEHVPDLVDGFLRVRRYEIDAELTALIVDARIERAASRRRHWPGRLLSIGGGVCPDEKWTYRLFENGTVRFAFEGRVAESDSPAVRMPFEFLAGKPMPPPKRPRSPS